MKERYNIICPDTGNCWEIPTSVIAQSHAKYYARVDGITEEESMKNTIELFGCDREVEDWAKNNMNWTDVEEHAVLVKTGTMDMQDVWLDGTVEIH